MGQMPNLKAFSPSEGMDKSVRMANKDGQMDYIFLRCGKSTLAAALNDDTCLP
ncbi:Uncharacterised protein [Neisseria animaloris]|nr:Uncharacterised protein [Neisseria animaloris]